MEECSPCLVDGDSRRRKLLVVCVDGWSRDTMEYFIREKRDVADFDYAPAIPMPGLAFCANPYCAVFVLLIILIVMFPNPVTIFLWIGVFIIVFPIVAILSFRFSIRRGIDILEKHFHRIRPDVVLAFSWGGGILAAMIAEKKWLGKTVLMSPCHHVMSRIAMTKPPSLVSAAPSTLRVFCAQDDPFVPSKDLNKIFNECRGKVTILRDDHRLFSPQSRRSIFSAIQGLLFSPPPSSSSSLSSLT